MHCAIGPVERAFVRENNRGIGAAVEVLDDRLFQSGAHMHRKGFADFHLLAGNSKLHGHFCSVAPRIFFDDPRFSKHTPLKKAADHMAGFTLLSIA
jgi:hypothetical protein